MLVKGERRIRDLCFGSSPSFSEIFLNLLIELETQRDSRTAASKAKKLTGGVSGVRECISGD
jgi:hypothetical protein